MIDTSNNESNRIPENLQKGKFKVLFVEDDDPSRDVIKELFMGRKDVQMEFYSTGKKALEVLKKAKEINASFNLVVTDWSIEDKFSGANLAEEIKEKKLSPRTFMLTAFSERLTTDLKQKGIGEIIQKTEIIKLRNSVYRELFRQQELQISKKESKEVLFDMHDLTFLEHLIIGGTEDIIVNGNKIFFNTDSFKELQKDKDALKIILAPINKGKKSPEDMRRVRENKELHAPILGLFEFEPQYAYIKKGIEFGLELGELDKNDQSKTFGIYFVQNNKKISLPEKAPEEILVEDEFKNLISYTGNKDEIMWYKINTVDEDKQV